MNTQQEHGITGYTIKGKEGTDNENDEFVWVPCTLTETSETVAFKRIFPETTSKNDPYYAYNKNSDLKVIEDQPEEQKIETSVSEHGGFYIAKYEAGIDGTTDNYHLENRVTDGYNRNIKIYSQPGKGVLDYIQHNVICTVANAMVKTSDGVKSTLISGTCWDTTLQWMVKKSDNADKNAGYDIDSTGKGNNKDTCEIYGKPGTTGLFEVNGIYDMAGNVEEYTTETMSYYGGTVLIIRGGSYEYGLEAASRSNGQHGYEYERTGFRVVLYK